MYMYIAPRLEHYLGVLEKLRIRTIGMKNVLTEELAGKPLPLALFLDESLRTKG